MSKLKKWDLNAVFKGNWEKWLSIERYRTGITTTQSSVIGAWGRKRNILWLGTWKGSNA